MDRGTLALTIATGTPWDPVLMLGTPDRWDHVHDLALMTDARRSQADYNTGSIEPLEAILLWGVAERARAVTVIEVGTFIGFSTEALAAAPTVTAVYTCDASNDCFPSHGKIRTYPRQRSRVMLRELARWGVVADLVFLDGVLTAGEVETLHATTHERTTYLMHDYTFGPKVRKTTGGRTYEEIVPRKGIGNVRLLAPELPRHTLIAPLEGTTLAALVPDGDALAVGGV